MTAAPFGKYRRTLLAPTCNPVIAHPVFCVLTTIAVPADRFSSFKSQNLYRVTAPNIPLLKS
jgi:hypothetical protein